MKLIDGTIFAALGLLFCLLQAVVADVKCNSTHSCPEDAPCCSQYGVCGTGAYCLGGCDIRSSYNLSACMPMPRMSSFDTQFTSTNQLEKQTEYLGNYSEADWLYTGYLGTHDDALLLQMPKDSAGTVISSSSYLWYGRVSAKLKTSHRQGVITAFILFSDVQDEIDYEFVGYNLTSAQTNYYSHGILNYNNAKNTSATDTFENYHTYEIDWQEDKIDWYLNGDKVRTLEKNSTWNETTKRHDFPQTPCRVQMSLWPGGALSNGQGTIEWAGGEIDWDASDLLNPGYYYAYLKEVNVTTYDLPDGVKKVNGSDSNDFNAFLYNSTDGNQENIYLTNKKTWLGSDEATGFDPDNDTDDKDGKKSSKSNSDSTGETTKTANVPTGIGNGGAGKAQPTTTTSLIDYNPSNGIGGFIQNSKKTSSAAANSKHSSSSSNNGTNDSTSSSNDSNSYNLGGFTILTTLLIGVCSIFM